MGEKIPRAPSAKSSNELTTMLSLSVDDFLQCCRVGLKCQSKGIAS
jgi:hypothetical protein